MSSEQQDSIRDFIDLLSKFVSALDSVGHNWLQSSRSATADGFERWQHGEKAITYRDRAFEARNSIKELAPRIVASITPPPDQTAKQFLGSILYEVELAWHLCRFVHCESPDDEPEEPSIAIVVEGLHKQLPLHRDKIWKYWQHLNHIESLSSPETVEAGAQPPVLDLDDSTEKGVEQSLEVLIRTAVSEEMRKAQDRPADSKSDKRDILDLPSLLSTAIEENYGDAFRNVLERLAFLANQGETEAEVVRAHRKRLFPKGAPSDTDLLDAIVKLDSERTKDNTDIKILRDFMNEVEGSDPKAKKLQGRIRKARQDGRTSLPPR